MDHVYSLYAALCPNGACWTEALTRCIITAQEENRKLKNIFDGFQNQIFHTVPNNRRVQSVQIDFLVSCVSYSHLLTNPKLIIILYLITPNLMTCVKYIINHKVF
jgi:hypothetical protein